MQVDNARNASLELSKRSMGSNSQRKKKKKNNGIKDGEGDGRKIETGENPIVNGESCCARNCSIF